MLRCILGYILRKFRHPIVLDENEFEWSYIEGSTVLPMKKED
jgi:hypothetical protein